MPKVIKFTYNTTGQLGVQGYRCDLPGDQSGEYVPLAEAAPLLELEKIIRVGVALVEKLNAGELDLIEQAEARAKIRAGYPEILRVLREIADCRKALE